MDKQKHTSKPSTGSSDFSAQLLAFLKQVQKFFQEFWHFLKTTTIQIGHALRELWHNFLRSFARWADPKLEPYRAHPLQSSQSMSQASQPAPSSISHQDQPDDNRNSAAPIAPEPTVTIKEETYTPAAPASRDELFAILREAPMSVLTSSERKTMSALFELEDTPVAEIMTPARKIVYVDQAEVLGPLVLDKLYRSGFDHFPVIDGRQHIIGTLQTARLNQLDVKDSATATSLMNPHVYYVRDDYTLVQALKAFLRTGEQLFIVTDYYEKTVGLLSFQQLLEFLFGTALQDDFSRDDDRIAVAKRKTHKKSAK